MLLVWCKNIILLLFVYAWDILLLVCVRNTKLVIAVRILGWVVQGILVKEYCIVYSPIFLQPSCFVSQQS